MPISTLKSLELRCPPLPQTLTEAVNLMNHPERLEVGPVVEIVQRDPMVVARLLRTVNSSYYGLRHAISSAERSVIMLGPIPVTGIIVGMNMLKLKAIMSGSAGPLFTKLISHSIATAFLTQHLLEGPPRAKRGARRQGGQKGLNFTAGLLHDFGKIILVYNFPEQAAALYEDARRKKELADDDLRHLEQLMFGSDHTEAGEYVARKHHFPETLTHVIRHHHQWERIDDPEVANLAAATHAGNIAAKAMGYGFIDSMTWGHVLKDPVWDHLIARRMVRFDSVPDIIDDLKEYRTHLDEYVEGVMDPEKKSTGKVG